MWESIVAFFTADGFTYEFYLAFLPILPLLRPRKYAWARIPASVIVGILISCLTFGYCVGENRLLSSLWYVGIALITLGLVIFCFKGNFWHALFLTMSAYVIQHIQFRTTNLSVYLLHVLGADAPVPRILSYIFGMVAIYAVSYFCFTARIRKEKNFEANNVRLLVSTSLIVIALIILNLYTERELEAHGLEYSSIGLFNSLFGLILGLILLDGLYTNVYNRKLKEDYQIVQLLWQSDRRQYEAYRRSLETMHIKYHDLKHQLGLLSQGASGGERQWLDEAIESVNTLGRIQQTGSGVLDVLLAEKMTVCAADSIDFVPIVNGALLSGLEDVDVYSLFGNALDNAIEYLRTVSDPEKRVLQLNVWQVGKMVKIEVENYAERFVPIVDGFPQTTKQDKQNHGYGVKSIAYIVEKYGGIMHFENAKSAFILDIMLPLK